MRPGLCLALLALLIPAPGPFLHGPRGEEVASYPDRPPPAHTGGFGEPTCHACHWGSDLNDARGSVALDGLPRRFQPGDTYELTIRLAHPELERAGFQLTARFAEGPRSGENAGALGPGAGMEVYSSGESQAVDYLQQTLEGAEVDEAGTAIWTFRWRAPEETRHPVVFHLSANAANYDLSEVGDYVYALERKVRAPLLR